MPLCLTDLAPPAFTAPCRNQISEPASLKGKRCASRISSRNPGISALGRRAMCRLCARSYSSDRARRCVRVGEGLQALPRWDGLKAVPTSRPLLNARQLGCYFGQGGMPQVARREYRLTHRPRDRERRVVPGDADFAAGIVEVGALVLDLRDRAEDAEPVREAGRNVALLEVVGAQTSPTPTARRSATRAGRRRPRRRSRLR